MKVLFSPIGTTDPIRDCFDGPMLHIARCYKPDSIWLFLSAEMLKKDERDNRYEKSIIKILPDCDVRKIRHPEITNPADFDAYLKHFPQIIKDIRQEYEDAEILVNVSSGTTQMTASVCLEVLNESILLRPIQVLTPSKRSNMNIGYTNDYSDFDMIWDNNLDNLDETESRCIEPPIISFKLTKIKSQTLSLIDTYEYKAALALVDLYKEYFNKEFIELLNHAALRTGFYFRQAEKYADKKDKELYPIVTSPVYDLYEALCIMKILQRKGEINDLIVKISPFLTKLTEEYIIKHLKYREFSKLYIKLDNGSKKFIRRKIENADKDLLKHLDREYGSFRNSFMGFDNLIEIIKYLLARIEDRTSEIYKKASKDLADFEDLRVIEEVFRNQLAHNLRAFDDEDIRKICGDSKELKHEIKNSKDLVNLMERAFKNTYGSMLDGMGFVYDTINERLIRYIDSH